MKLTREQRGGLFKGKPPKITFPGAEPCPISIGHVERLSAHVRFEVTDVRRTRDGDHALVYTLYNNRLGQRFLASQDGQKHPEQYTHSGISSVDPEGGQAVDDAEQREITKKAQAPNRELRKQRRLPEPEGLRREQRSLEARLGLARKVAEVRQVDISPHVRTIEKRLQKIESVLAATERAA